MPARLRIVVRRETGWRAWWQQRRQRFIMQAFQARNVWAAMKLPQAWPCACEKRPGVVVKPSGVWVCGACGGRVVPTPPPKKVKP